MAKLEIFFTEADDTKWERFDFKQEGMTGLKLEGAYLPEFVEALENSNLDEVFYFFQDYFVRKSKTNVVVGKSTLVAPLLQISTDQCAKLVLHLRSTYAALISVYRCAQ